MTHNNYKSPGNSKRRFDIHIEKNFEVSKVEYGLFTSRVLNSVEKLTSKVKSNEDLAIRISISEFSSSNQVVKYNLAADGKNLSGNSYQTLDERAKAFKSSPPKYNFEFLKVSQSLKERLLMINTLVRDKKLIFDQWNLKSVEPHPSLVFNFFGPPGTGKTLAAHAIADLLKIPMLIVKYSQIDDKYVAENAKNAEAMFLAAKRDGALLFIDEADSLFSSRVTNLAQGSEYGINALRATLLTTIDEFEGIVILATNLVQNIDFAFTSRMEYLKFDLPTKDLREQIWRQHLPSELPLENLSVSELAAVDNVSGRDIKKAIVNAALRARYKNQSSVNQQDLLTEILFIKTKNGCSDIRSD
ncbi:MAG: ATP-binding protein [Symploca sp. SIO1C4]|uniref:ATP-binding protein n=1 Tax=Symploca sp. SIO1C4 TaxID=2607765 RepID=A0A6B3NAR7_9CYAN|nr:ATP-binding protein [Symploca sp. SIO1C4]